MRPVVVSSSGPALQPYWPLLVKDFDLVFLRDDAAQSAKAATGWPVEGLQTYAAPLSAMQLWQAVGEIVRAIDWDKAHAAFPPQAQADKWLLGFIMQQLGNIVPHLLALDNLRQKRQVAGVLLHEDVTNGANYVAQWAAIEGIPCVHVAHGSYGSMKADKGEDRNIHLYLTADTICVWNEAQQAAYLRQGALPSQVRLTGSGMMDKWFRMQPDRAFACDGYGLDRERPVVTFIGDFALSLGEGAQVGADRITEGFHTFCEAVKLLPDWQVIARPHPGTHAWDANWHANIMRKHGVHGVVVAGESMELIAQASDVFVTPTGSMANVEASVIGVPSCGARGLDNSRDDNPFWTLYEAGDAQSLADAIKAARGKQHETDWQEARNREVYAMAWLPDGKATERVMAVLKERFGG